MKQSLTLVGSEKEVGPDDQCLRSAGAARFIGCSDALMRKWRAARMGPPFIRVGKRLVLYQKSDLKKFLEAHRVGG